jgi:CheY-like chemotaxis protein/anti-sigma regulatory factor (Ser/Thr protein kinase)
VEILAAMEGDPVLMETRDVMERQINHMVRLVDDLLDLGRISSGRLVLNKEPMDLRASVLTAIEAVKPLLKAKGQYLDEHLPKQPVMINGDAARVTQVMTNLLHNASKFSAAGGTVDLTVKAVKSEVLVTVRDNGIGIPQAMQERVFDMFAQVDPEERAKAGGGLGIGLHIVKRVVVMHGGDIAVSSEGKGSGSTFTMHLPLVEEYVPHSAPVEAPMPDGTKHRVLIIDDNSDSALMLAMVLRALACETRIAHGCDEAMRLGSTFSPTLVFTDIGMPGVDGYETCQRMRRTDWGASAHILALTGWGQEEDRKKSHEAGFDAHLVKPIDRTTLLKVLAEAEQNGAEVR